jgi:hypothetical protein
MESRELVEGRFMISEMKLALALNVEIAENETGLKTGEALVKNSVGGA